MFLMSLGRYDYDHWDAFWDSKWSASFFQILGEQLSVEDITAVAAYGAVSVMVRSCPTEVMLGHACMTALICQQDKGLWKDSAVPVMVRGCATKIMLDHACMKALTRQQDKVLRKDSSRYLQRSACGGEELSYEPPPFWVFIEDSPTPPCTHLHDSTFCGSRHFRLSEKKQTRKLYTGRRGLLAVCCQALNRSMA